MRYWRECRYYRAGTFGGWFLARLDNWPEAFGTGLEERLGDYGDEGRERLNYVEFGPGSLSSRR